MTDKKLELTAEEQAKLAGVKGKLGYNAPRPGYFSGQVKRGADVYREVGEIESKVGATKEENVAKHQRRHPIPPEFTS